MARYSYLAIDRKGNERRGAVEAAGEAQAAAKLSERQWFVVRIAPDAAEAAARAAVPGKPGTRFAARMSAGERALFTRQLAALVTVCPIEEALRLIVRQSVNARVRAVACRVQVGVANRLSLAEAMRQEAPSFPPVYRAIIAAGENSGTLAATAARLADGLDRSTHVVDRTRAGWLRMGAHAFVGGGIALVLFLPRIALVAASGVRGVVESGPLRTGLAAPSLAGLVLLAGILAVVLVGALPGRARLWCDALLLRLPLLGRLLRSLHAARLADTLATMIEARLPLVDSLRLAEASLGNRAMARALGMVTAQVRAGASLASALREVDVFPSLFVQLAMSGEASGQLAPMLECAAQSLDQERDALGDALRAVIEPLLAATTATLVAIAVSLFRGG